MIEASGAVTQVSALFLPQIGAQALVGDRSWFLEITKGSNLKKEGPD